MDDAVERVEISGATLALILRELGSSPGDSDGLLFGRLHRGIKHNFQDEPRGDSPTREERVAIITGCCCPGSLLTFYSGAGSVEEHKLGLLAGESRRKWGSDPVIGWFLGRRGSPMRPSMREASVTHALASKTPALGSRHSPISSKVEPQVNESPPPFLFMLVAEVVSPENGIRTQDYKVFQYRTRDRSLHPHRVVIRNVGRSSGSTQGEAYESFLPVAPLPWVMDPSSRDEDEVDSWRLVGETPEEVKNRGLIRRKQQRLLDMYAEKLSIDQLQEMISGRNGGLEMIYPPMLAKMQQLTVEARQSSGETQKQEDWIAELRASARSNHS